MRKMLLIAGVCVFGFECGSYAWAMDRLTGCQSPLSQEDLAISQLARSDSSFSCASAQSLDAVQAEKKAQPVFSLCGRYIVQRENGSDCVSAARSDDSKSLCQYADRLFSLGYDNDAEAAYCLYARRNEENKGRVYFSVGQKCRYGYAFSSDKSRLEMAGNELGLSESVYKYATRRLVYFMQAQRAGYVAAFLPAIEELDMLVHLLKTRPQEDALQAVIEQFLCAKYVVLQRALDAGDQRCRSMYDEAMCKCRQQMQDQGLVL